MTLSSNPAACRFKITLINAKGLDLVRGSTHCPRFLEALSIGRQLIRTHTAKENKSFSCVIRDCYAGPYKPYDRLLTFDSSSNEFEVTILSRRQIPEKEEHP